MNFLSHQVGGLPGKGKLEVIENSFNHSRISAPSASALYLIVLAVVSLVSSCVYLKPASIPILSEYYNYHETNSTLIVLLPGFDEPPTNFIKFGAVEQIIACQSNINILGVDSHFGYYRDATIIERLHEDIIKPARDAGIQKIWLLGISLGGLGSLIYRQTHPEEIEAVIVMAPYIGEWDELSAYQSEPKKSRETIRPELVELWDGLTTIPVDDPAITLAFGENDYNSKQHQWFASLLNEDKVVSGPGGHRWTVWQKLWPKALRRSGLCNSS